MLSNLFLFDSKGAGGSSISVLNLAEVTSGSASFSSLGEDSSSYFRSLHQRCLPGPLVGGNVGNKDLNKWLDESILHCESSDMDFSRGKLLKMLMSLLRISCQYYGKLRSPFGADTTQKVSSYGNLLSVRLLRKHLYVLQCSHPCIYAANRKQILLKQQSQNFLHLPRKMAFKMVAMLH